MNTIDRDLRKTVPPSQVLTPRGYRSQRSWGRTLEDVAAISVLKRALLAFVLTLALGGVSDRASAQAPSTDDILSAVVRVKTLINPEGRTLQSLGRERDGSGVVIDSNGLVLTIGYLMVEAYAAEVTTVDGRTIPANIVGYDNETGFGLLQATSPLKVHALPLGSSAAVKEGDPVLIAAHSKRAVAVAVVSKREFAGNWEYLLDQAIFTSPPFPEWSGAALVSRDGKLIGIGSLIVGDANGKGDGVPGNMFVPIDRLAPILADLMTTGRVSQRAPPWLGLTTEEARGGLVVVRVTEGGPAEQAGVKRGDVITGVGGNAPRDLIDFYRKVRALGPAGTLIPLDVQQDGAARRVDVKSMNRLDHLKLKTTF